MTDHPHDLFAEYVDGALGPTERASIEAHLASCPACRQEEAMAREAREALASLPEVEAPSGIALRIRREARRPSRTGRWIAAAAAAAVLAGAGVVVVTRGPLGGGEDGGGEQGGAPAAPAPARTDDQGERAATPESQALDAAGPDAGAVVYFETDRDYDLDSLAGLAPRLRARAAASLRRGFAATTERFFANLELDSVPPRARRAIRCASEGLPPDEPAAPFMIEAARFEGEPVYVAAFLRGPDPGARHDRILIWVVDRETCTLRYFAAQRL